MVFRTSYDSDYQVYTLSDASAVLQNPYYRNTLPTALYIHGYKESTQVDSVRTVTNAYLTNDGFNTLVLDWGALAVGLYPLVVGRVAHVANRMVQVLLVLFAEGLPIRTFHLVGHSLGGQMAGAIGNGVRERSSQQITLERITALDPAGPLYYSLLHIIPILEKQISSTSARFVDVIHTDAGFFGQANACGHVDFWPNAGTRHQPGCDFIDSLLSLQNRNIFCRCFESPLNLFLCIRRALQSHSILDVLGGKFDLYPQSKYIFRRACGELVQF